LLILNLELFINNNTNNTLYATDWLLWKINKSNNEK
jgi:hypothetical protein